MVDPSTLEGAPDRLQGGPYDPDLLEFTPFDNPLPSNVGRTCDLPLKNRTWQRWWNATSVIIFGYIKFHLASRLTLCLHFWLWRSKLPWCWGCLGRKPHGQELWEGLEPSTASIWQPARAEAFTATTKREWILTTTGVSLKADLFAVEPLDNDWALADTLIVTGQRTQTPDRPTRTGLLSGAKFVAICYSAINK